MICDELRDEYELYALGMSEGPERRELEAHLERRCPHCVPGVAEALETVAAMAVLADPETPPARLRRRLMASIGAEREPRGHPPGVREHYLFGCGVIRKYGFSALKPFGNLRFSSSGSWREGTITQSSPCFQSAGVATW